MVYSKRGPMTPSLKCEKAKCNFFYILLLCLPMLVFTVHLQYLGLHYNVLIIWAEFATAWASPFKTFCLYVACLEHNGEHLCIICNLPAILLWNYSYSVNFVQFCLFSTFIEVRSERVRWCYYDKLALVHVRTNFKDWGRGGYKNSCLYLIGVITPNLT